MRHNRSTVMAVIMAVVLAACAGYAGKSAFEQAKLGYVDASLAYELSAQTITDLRAAHIVSDAQWSRFDEAQKKVRQYAPLVRTGLDVWETTGSQPASYAAALAKLLAAFADVQAVKAEVRP